MADIQDFFGNYLPTKLIEKPELSVEINNSYRFDIDGAGIWTVDLTKTPGQVREGAEDDPGCILTAAEKDFNSLLDNPSAAFMLFSMGKIKVSNVGLALSLQKLLS